MIKYWSKFRRFLGRISSNHVFKSQILHKDRYDVADLGLPVYYETEEFRLLMIEAISLIKSGDQILYNDIGRQLRAIVEISSGSGNINFGQVGISSCVYYGEPLADTDPTVSKIASACTIVQWTVCCKLVNKVNQRCPNRYSTELMRRIKRMSIVKMHKFTIDAGLGSQYSYEIECKLKNGAYEC